MRRPAETTVAVLRAVDANLMLLDGPLSRCPPTRGALQAELLQAEQRWRTSRGRRRDEAMREMLRISKAIDAL
jgi:hypothetical protein